MGGVWSKITNTFIFASSTEDGSDVDVDVLTYKFGNKKIQNHRHSVDAKSVTSYSGNCGTESSHTHTITNHHHASGSLSGGSHTHGANILMSDTAFSSTQGTITSSTSATYAYLKVVESKKDLHRTNTNSASVSISGYAGSMVTTGNASGTITSGSGSSHSHTINHGHTLEAHNTNYFGGGASEDSSEGNMPPYRISNCWKRVA